MTEKQHRIEEKVEKTIKHSVKICIEPNEIVKTCRNEAECASGKSIDKTSFLCIIKKVLCVCNIQVYFVKCSVDKEVHCHFFLLHKNILAQ